MMIMSALWEQLFYQLLLLLVSCRHISTNTPGLTPPPLEPTTPLPTDVRSVVLKGENHTEKIEVTNSTNLTLECIWTGNQNKQPNITGYWRKNGEDVGSSNLTVQLENEQYQLRRVFIIDSAENLGNYSCGFGNEATIDFILTAPQIDDVRDKPIVSYVGDSVVISCKVEDTKPLPSTWHWYKENGTDMEQIDVAVEPLRYKIKNEGRKTKLLVYNLTKADCGRYHCSAVYTLSTAKSHVELKVITYYEPLKPFMGIVAEVIVLVAAILLYERCQSRKKDAEDATENNTNADQTNTTTHGENSGLEGSSSIRQRKF